MVHVLCLYKLSLSTQLRKKSKSKAKARLSTSIDAQGPFNFLPSTGHIFRRPLNQSLASALPAPGPTLCKGMTTFPFACCPLPLPVAGMLAIFAASACLFFAYAYTMLKNAEGGGTKKGVSGSISLRISLRGHAQTLTQPRNQPRWRSRYRL